MTKIFAYIKDYKKECVLGPLFKLLEAAFELLVPLVVAKIIDNGIKNADNPYILKMCLIMIALGLIGLICSVTAQFFAAKAAVGFAAKLRHIVMKHILKFSYSRIDELGASTMITRMTSDINQIQNGVNLTLRLLLRSPFVVFGAMIMAFTIDFQSALVFAAVIPVLCIIVFGIMLVTIPLYKKVQTSLDGVTSTTRQNLKGVRVLRAFCKEKSEADIFTSQTDDLTQKQLSAGRISALMNPLTFVVINLAVVVLIQIGAVRVNNGILTQGLVVALYNYMAQILIELIKMANLIISMTKAAACAKRVQSVLDMQADGGCDFEASAESGTDIAGAVEFKNVTAKYKNAAEPSLEGISFKAEAGQTVGIIGGTGSGKTTLVNLIPGFYPICGGQLLIDGVPIESIDLCELRKHIGIVPQNAVLFGGTVADNLRWGARDASEEDMWEALKTAQAYEMIKNKENGLEYMIEQGGSNLSGGQRQRLTIARALVRKPSILILDDSTSALDYATDAELRRSLRAVPNPPTTFIVSQRAASVRFADFILVLDNGELAGVGTHDELLCGCEVYREIYYSQFPKEAREDEQ